MSTVIAITPGEPAGIGPELCLLALPRIAADIHPVLFADPQLIRDRANMLGLSVQVREFKYGRAPLPDTVDIIPTPLSAPSLCGQLDSSNSAYVLQTLDLAIAACESEMCDALVTGPVQKSIISEAGFRFRGHTEYLAEKCHCDQVVMMLATEGLRVALATTHLPLSWVPAAITQPGLKRTLDILDHDLRHHFGIEQPRILVCGLNPHAGENGHLGREEIDIIEPVIRDCNRRGMNLKGPLPADTLFTDKYLKDADAVLAMYHDQGLPVLKYKGFGKAVNITLGLPLIRTSVDHGTALDLAGSGKADPGSLLAAIACAADMAGRRNR